jgi:hypothetical protein
LKSSSPGNQTTFQALIPEDSASNPDPSDRVHQSENVEKPDDYGTHDNDIQNHLDLMIHWHVVIDEPQQNFGNHILPFIRPPTERSPIGYSHEKQSKIRNRLDPGIRCQGDSINLPPIQIPLLPLRRRKMIMITAITSNK